MTYFLSVQVRGFFILGPALSRKALQLGFEQTGENVR